MASSSIPPRCGIYLIINTKNGKFYIGQSQDINRRWNSHRSNLRKNTHSNCHLQRAWNIDGEDKFKFLVLEYCPIEQLDEREQIQLNAHVNGDNCYNIAVDATAPNRGRTGTMLGKHHTEETRRKISAAKKGKPGFSPSEDLRQKISAANKGKLKTPETRRKLSEAHRGKPAHNKGKPMGEEQKQKQSERMRGKPSPNLGKSMSEEQKQKLSEIRRKCYIVTNPEGIEFEVIGLTQFCAENNLNTECMFQIANGRQKQHKGWKCRKAES